MAIFTHFGEEVQLTEARLIPMWFVQRPYDRTTHYRKPTKVPKRASVEEFPSWHVRSTGEGGRLVCDGKWFEVISLTADDGWNEIMIALCKLNPTDAAKYNEWNKAGAPEASHFFPPIDPKEAA